MLDYELLTGNRAPVLSSGIVNIPIFMAKSEKFVVVLWVYDHLIS